MRAADVPDAPVNDDDAIGVPQRLRGAPNFRSLCGYRAADGRTVRRGVLFRSNALSDLSAADLEWLRTLDIRLVCDLRSMRERAARPNRWPSGPAPALLTAGDTGGPTAVKAAAWRVRLREPDFDAAAARRWMRDAYLAMPTQYAGLLAALFARLADGRAPNVLVHCAAGKDRTGFVCAMLLLALDVPWETVLADYLLSGRRQPAEALARKLWCADQGVPPLDARARAVLRAIAGVEAEYLTAACECAARHFGSVARYLEVACGLDVARCDCLRTRLLTN
ncbi:tyrosine-protein phosphatase [Thauera sp. Sel9]|uniref:tyrosine-protein phosphatase n=1 Tax=Thauera sp. Sel9 TaxID=2974299 RepID=UPI0021E123AB|nr:tyrosine-protein phosphatase [Thauera sp. Sel9]MCV2219125.1 tyrosine-protein phosphatase [Thauera sp. Sel9]